MEVILGYDNKNELRLKKRIRFRLNKIIQVINRVKKESFIKK